MDAKTLETKVDQLNAQVEQLIAQQESINLFLTEMGPVLTAVMESASVRLSEAENKGYFRFAGHMRGALDRIVEAYSEDDLAQFGESVVSIVDTVRNLTQPDIVALANEATDAIHNAGEAPPVEGVLGMYRASKDKDVQRGMAVMFEVLRHVGKGAKKMKRGQFNLPTRRTSVGQLPDMRRVKPEQRRPARAAKPPAAPTAGDPSGLFDEAGFLKDPSTWTREIGAQVAAKLGVAMTDEHWAVVEWVRGDHAAHGASPNVRRIGTQSGTDTRGVYRLFPKAPGKTIALIAGIPKPGGCI